ncbi:hypothetical protein NUW54_g14250 [Trametes sanguinea]|uniref:Uncharacterized protein n=1 Tax=Trametes sanguinea TaxID=158606 RepID=A0ACC1ME16_9APHY|nr:hypothetical protein NUW54_g14250 [Trametes sanguinea]
MGALRPLARKRQIWRKPTTNPDCRAFPRYLVQAAKLRARKPISIPQNTRIWPRKTDPEDVHVQTIAPLRPTPFPPHPEEPFRGGQGGDGGCCERRGDSEPSMLTDLLERSREGELDEDAIKETTAVAFGVSPSPRTSSSPNVHSRTPLPQTAATLHAFILAMILHPSAQRRAQAELAAAVGPSAPRARDRAATERGGRGSNGGVWEWTATVLDAQPGFVGTGIFPGYSADFFDGKHQVVLGASYATIPRLADRRTVRNFYQHNYPYPWVARAWLTMIEGG